MRLVIIKAPMATIFRKHKLFSLNAIKMGPKAVRPHHVRDIPAEVNIIAKSVLRINGMSGQLT